MPQLFNTGPDYSPIIQIGKTAQQVGETLTTGATSGGTPFQKAALASYKKTALANWDAYAKQFGAAGGKDFGALDVSGLTEQDTQKLGETFVQSDFNTGLKALGLAGESFSRAAGISAQQNAQMMQAAGSLVGVLGAIFA